MGVRESELEATGTCCLSSRPWQHQADRDPFSLFWKLPVWVETDTQTHNTKTDISRRSPDSARQASPRPPWARVLLGVGAGTSPGDGWRLWHGLSSLSNKTHILDGMNQMERQ